MARAEARARRSPTLKAWVQGLTLRGEKIPIHRVYQRVIHPGLIPIAGDGFLAAQPGRQLDLPGSWAHCVAVLHWFERGEQGNLLAAEEQDSALGALLTLVTDRRCQVVPELFAKVEDAAHHIAIPTYGQIDPALASPMPDWDVLTRDFRATLARIASLDDADAETISAAMHMHYCAALLAGGDLSGAYALVVGGLETLAREYGSPPHDWAEWDKAAQWDAFMAEQQLTEEQSAALRERLRADVPMRLAETFATYVCDRLPALFWEEPVGVYVWGVNGVTGEPAEGTWEAGPPRVAFAADRRELKKALKRSYVARSRFIHVGERGVAFADELVSRIPGRDEARLSFAVLRSALRTLILLELESRGTDRALPPLEVRLGAEAASAEAAS